MSYNSLVRALLPIPSMFPNSLSLSLHSLSFLSLSLSSFSLLSSLSLPHMQPLPTTLIVPTFPTLSLLFSWPFRSFCFYIYYPSPPLYSLHLSIQNSHHTSTLIYPGNLKASSTMCNSKLKSENGVVALPPAVAEIDGRPVLQPASNRVPPPQSNRPLKKSFQKSISLPSAFTKSAAKTSPFDVDTNETSLVALRKLSAAPLPLSPTSKPAEKIPKAAAPPKSTSAAVVRKKPKKSQSAVSLDSLSFPAERAPGSIAAAQREQAILVQAQRKMKIAHYGRTPAKLEGIVLPVDSSSNAQDQEKKCSFITPNSDPLYVAYHDQEWGVPLHDDKMLFELIVLSGAQVGLDWTSILKKRSDFREAFAGFDAETVSKFTEKQMASISAGYELDLAKVRGVVDNANRILEVARDFGSLDNYLWGFVNHKPISTNYKASRKIPIKTSKSESISKDMVRRGFRFVGPTVIHSFMQAAGLTNDHLVSCPRHLHCCCSSL